MNKIMNKKLYARRVLAMGLSALLAATSVPDGMYSALAAAKKPAVVKTATVAMNGTKKISITKNGYKIISAKWKTGKKAVAQVKGTKSAGTVYGIKSGTATITATVKAKKGGKTKSFKLTMKVTVKAPSASLSKKTLKVGGSATIKVANAPAKAKITYASSNTKVATVKGTKVTAVKKGTAKIKVKIVLPKTKYAKKVTKTLNAGTVTVKGTTGDNTTSAAPSVAPSETASTAPSAAPSAEASTAPSAEASATPAATPNPNLAVTVKSQAELDAALKVNEPKVVTIGDFAGTLTIAEGNYDQIELEVDAPQATITNYGKFKTITIRAIASNTWNEKGDGNSIIASSKSPLHIVIDTLKSLASLIFNGNSATASRVEIKNGTVNAINIKSSEPVNITAEGSSKVEAVTIEGAADVDVQTKGTSEVAKISVEAQGADVDLKASEDSSIGTVDITEKASSSDGTEAAKRTKVDIVTEGHSKVEKVETGAANTAVTVEANGNSTVSTVKVTGEATATVSGDSRNITTLDLTAAGDKAKVDVKTDTVKVEAKEDTKTDDIINNTSGKELTTTIEKADGTTSETTTKADASSSGSGSGSGGGSSGGSVYYGGESSTGVWTVTYTYGVVSGSAITSGKPANDTVTVSKGSGLFLPDDLKAQGYTFKGWKESDGDGTYLTGNYIPTKDVTLIAQWEDSTGGSGNSGENENQWMVVLTYFGAVHESVMATSGAAVVTSGSAIKVVSGSGITVSDFHPEKSPERKSVNQGDYLQLPRLVANGYEFKGWIDGRTGQLVDYVYTPTENVILLAWWQESGTTNP